MAQPFPHGSGGKLRSIIRADMLRDTTENKQVKQEIDNILAPNLAGYQYRQAFPGKFIDDGQYFKGPAISDAYLDPIISIPSYIRHIFLLAYHQL